LKKTTLLITVVAIIVMLIFVGRMYYSEADFTLENPSWNGFSRLSGVDLQPLYATADLADLGPSDTLLIVSPIRDYTQEESDSVS
jgi:hypothetical protein